MSGGNKDSGLKLFKNYVSIDKRLGPPRKKDDSLLARPTKVANRPRGSNRGYTTRDIALNWKFFLPFLPGNSVLHNDTLIEILSETILSVIFTGDWSSCWDEVPCST